MLRQVVEDPVLAQVREISSKALSYQDSRSEGTGSDQLSIDLIDGAAAVCYVTSGELKYMTVQSWGVGVGKRVMP